MKKSNVNFVIDALMFFCMAAIAGIGLLMNNVLLSGRETWDAYGTNVELEFLWMDRHTWGDIHLYFGYILLSLLALHIILHWKMITGLYKNLIPDPVKRRNTAIVFIGICFILFLFSFVVSPQKGEFIRGNRRNLSQKSNIENVQTSFDVPQESSQENSQNQGAQPVTEPEEHTTPYEVRGFMTFSEIGRKYGVPSDYLKKKMGLPISISDNEKLGFLRRRHPFKMSDIERYIDEYKRK